MSEKQEQQNTERSRMLGTMEMRKLVPTVSVPIMVSMLVQALYNIVDGIFVGQYSPDALTAVNLAMPMQMLMIAVSTARIRRAFAEEIPDTTKLIIAQRISSIQSADRIIVMDEGKISGFGTHEELMKTNAIYQEVYNSQIKGGGDFDENRGGEQA